MSAYQPVVQLPQNTQGRDFCVGDLHGMYQLLEKLLIAARFDKTTDRLISVGDLVDRGPESHKALIYLNEPWFHAIRGNHEQLLMDCHDNPDNQEIRMVWNRNGGLWWESQPDSTRRAIYRRFSKLPIAIEIPTQRGLIGIVHADIPDHCSWQQFIQAVETGNEAVIKHALWSRRRIRTAASAIPVEGVHEIYCGHTIVESPIKAGNIHFIDTGAYMGQHGRLTLVDLHAGPDHRFSLSAI